LLLNEIDELKKGEENTLLLIRRVNDVEAKNQEMWETIQKGIGLGSAAQVL
jgi:hypothetical protein